MKKYTKIICMIAAVCLLGTAAFCSFHIYSHYAHESEQEEVFEKIAEVVEQAQTGESETTDVLRTEEETVLAEYDELYLQNTDMVGWLSIAGTNINYPVMQTTNNPNYYLKHNFEKEYSDLGTPYVQENCDLLTSDNLVIYGHHIKGQKMFGALENYKNKDFYEEHKTIRFDTLTKQGEYEIIAVFKTVAYSSAGFGVTNKTISRWENGNYMPDVEMLSLLSKEFGVSINELISGERLWAEDFKKAADDNLVTALNNSTFTLKEKIVFFKKKWLHEHISTIVLCVVAWIGIIIWTALKLRGSDSYALLGAIGSMLAILFYVVLYNRMMVYVENHAYRATPDKETETKN